MLCQHFVICLACLQVNSGMRLTLRVVLLVVCFTWSVAGSFCKLAYSNVPFLVIKKTCSVNVLCDELSPFFDKIKLFENAVKLKEVRRLLSDTLFYI